MDGWMDGVHGVCIYGCVYMGDLVESSSNEKRMKLVKSEASSTAGRQNSDDRR
jgi:hypothetical protein